MVKRRRDLLNPGESFETHQGSFTIVEKLGVGLTCEVYRATRISDGYEAALKVMRPGLPTALRKRFTSEGRTLADIMAAEDRLGDGLRLIPEYLGMEPESDPPYILLEFVSGQRVPELLGQQGRLDESIALIIGWQFCRLLSLLHDDLGQTYADLKLENIWWLADRLQIKVTDWNVLGEKTPDNVVQDLLRFSLYLYHMLTGAALEERRGEIVGRLDAAEAWPELGWGTQEILKRALHRNRQVRHQTAGELRKALEDQCDLWSVDGKDLLLRAQRELRGEPNRESYREAKILVDMARRRPSVSPTAAEEVEAKVEAGLVSTDLLEIGRKYFSTPDYASAAQKFEEASDRAAEPVVALRWTWLARAALEDTVRFDPVRTEAVQGLEYLIQGEHRLAVSYLEDAYKSCQVEGLQVLRDEARLRRLVEEGSQATGRGEHSKAAATFREALQLWEALPYRDVLHEEIGDLGTYAQDADRLSETVGAALELKRAGQEALVESRVQDASNNFSDALNNDPGNAEVLDSWRGGAEELIGDGQFASALQLLNRGMLRPDSADALRRQWNLASDLQEIVELFRWGEYELGIKRAEHLVQAFADYPVAAQAMQRLVERAHQMAVDAREIPVAERLVKLTQEPDSSWVAQLAEQREAARERLEEQQANAAQPLLAEAARLSEERTLVDWEKAVPASKALRDTSREVLKALREANRILRRVEMMIRPGQPRWEEFLELRREVRERLEEREALHELLGREHKVEIGQCLESTKQLLRKAERLGRIGNELREINVSEATLADERAEALAEALKMCEEALALDPDHNEAVELRRQVRAQLNKGGALAWSVVRRRAEDVLQDVEGAMERAKEAYASGNAGPALNSLQSIAQLSSTVEGYAQLAEQVKASIDFEEWAASLPPGQAADAEALRQAEDFLSQRIPAIFWREGQLLTALKSAEVEALRRFCDLSYPDESLFLPRLKDFLRANQARRRVEEAMKHGSPQSAEPTWDSAAVLHSARGLVRAWVAKRWRIRRFAGQLARVSASQEELERLTQDLVKQVRQEEERSKERRRKAGKAVSFAVAGLVAIMLCVLAGSIALYQFGPPAVSQRGPIQSIAQLLGLPARPAPPPAPEPEPTQPTPTATPAPPTPTLPPAPTPESRYLREKGEFQPDPPMESSAFFLLDEFTSTTAQTSTLSAYPSAGVGGSMQYMDHGGLGIVSWTMDLPLEPGLYEILANDPVEKSEGVELSYEVLVDDQPRDPLVGTKTVEQWPSEVQERDRWVSLGIYEIEHAGVVSVRLRLGEVVLSGDGIAGIDAILIVAMDEPEPPRPMGLPDSESPLLLVVEDPTALEPDVDWEDTAGTASWDGFKSTSVLTSTSVVSATWEVTRPLPAGSYELWVWVPATREGQERAAVQYSISVGTEPLKQISDTGTRGVWFPLGEVALAEDQRLGVTMESTPGTRGEVVADSLVVLPAPPEAAAQ